MLTDPAAYGVLRVTDRTGGVYLLPDVCSSTLRGVLPPMGRAPEGQPTLTVVNMCKAVLCMPLRVIDTIHLGEELLWHGLPTDT